MNLRIPFGLGLAVGLALATGAASAQDAAKGEKIFVRCKACHVFNTETNKIGPHLGDVFGRKAGSVADYKYSTAMKNYGVVWNEETLNVYLENPKGVVKGTKMSYAGVKKDDQRADLIAYLKQGPK